MSQADTSDERRVSWSQRYHQGSNFDQGFGESTQRELTTKNQNQPNQTQFPTHQLASIYNTSSVPLSPEKQSSSQDISFSSLKNPETSFSVLPVGHRNFLKVQNNIEGDQPQIFFNNYELFTSNVAQTSSNDHKVKLGCSFNEDALDSISSIQSHQSESSVIEPPVSTTNMIINKLVNNWSPNLTGACKQFEDQNITSLPIKSFVATNSSSIPEVIYAADLEDLNNTSTPVNVQNQNSLQGDSVFMTNGSFEKPNSAKTSIPDSKEVKSMRMSYSDVLSKINSGAIVGTPNGTSCNQGRESLGQSNKSSKTTIDYSKNSGFATERKVSPPASEKENIPARSKNTNKQGEQQYPTANNNTQKKSDRKSSPVNSNKNNLSTSSKSTKKTAGKPLKSNSKQPLFNQSLGGENNKKRSYKNGEDQSKSGNSSSENPSFGYSNDKQGFCNVPKKNIQFERYQKYNTLLQNNSASNSYGRKGRLNNGNLIGSKTNSRFENKHTFANRSGQNRGMQKKSTDKQQPFEKLFKNWIFEYTLIFLTWLFYVVYDVIVIGFSVMSEKASQAYASGYSYFLVLYQNLNNNSMKPSIWIQNYLKKFDKFQKNSKWAFWTKFYTKKTEESSPEFYKTGRLPQSGEEAMYSLLNCKGKDAYSILGVPANSSQEQIRKHYKKIAVLVHPDKNKQPGAEEAFKVLQRAFELIGEPESRAAYNQSLVETLHAEKAWTELHDLLSQLQTKISEASNTIRCSSCNFRHPRKLTDLPHYAARECGSCKIRHSAREGDIWAETDWLRLRWKYLALMEGKVYDITEWAYCQKGALSHLQPNSHNVQYRIVRGGQQKKQQNTQKSSNPTLDEFLDNVYSGQNPFGKSQNTTRKQPRRN